MQSLIMNNARAMLDIEVRVCKDRQEAKIFLAKRFLFPLAKAKAETLD